MKNTIMMAAIALSVTAPAFAMDDMSEADHKISMMDTDQDGMVSKAEMTTYTDVFFAKADTDEDGMISKEEMTHAMEAKHMDPDHADMMHEDGAHDDGHDHSHDE